MSDLVAVGLSILGGCTLFAGVFFLIAWTRTSMIREWTLTTGIVVDRRSGRADVGGLPAQYPTFMWRDAEGRDHRHTSSMRQSLGPSPGSLVRVRYDPMNPSRGMIDSFVQSGRIFWALGFIVLAFGILIGGFLLFAATQ